MKKHRRQNYFERISRIIQNKRKEALKRQIDSADKVEMEGWCKVNDYLGRLPATTTSAICLS